MLHEAWGWDAPKESGYVLYKSRGFDKKIQKLFSTEDKKLELY